MIALVTGATIGIAMLSYFLLMNHQNRMVHRGQAWNHALTLAEAGVEDALAQLNRAFGTNNSRGGANGWSGAYYGPAVLDAPRNLAGGSYSATISSGLPVITATGRVAVANSSQFVERRVQVFTTTEFAFRVAMASRRGITMNGNNILIDSYDSGDPNHCTPLGRYDPATAKAGGDVASAEGFIDVGNNDIKGKLYTGPINAGQYDVGPNGSVGSMAWSGPGIQPGWYFNDFNMDFISVDPPYTTGLPPGPLGGTDTNAWTLGNGQYYYSGNVRMNAQKTILVQGIATVYVTGNFEMLGAINLAPGAQLKLYVGGQQTRLNVVNNSPDGNAFNFQYYGLPSNLLISWTGNDEYLGTIYAPEAAFRLGGGGSDIYDFQGSCVVNSVTINGHFNFHYDENLRRRGPIAGFVVSKWEEI